MRRPAPAMRDLLEWWSGRSLRDGPVTIRDPSQPRGGGTGHQHATAALAPRRVHRDLAADGRAALGAAQYHADGVSSLVELHGINELADEIEAATIGLIEL